MAKYEKLTEWLRNPTVVLTFNEIENIIGDKLPPAALKFRPWWGNEKGNESRQCSSWLEAGWEVTGVCSGATVFMRPTSEENQKRRDYRRRVGRSTPHPKLFPLPRLIVTLIFSVAQFVFSVLRHKWNPKSPTPQVGREMLITRSSHDHRLHGYLRP
jgi:hypothetical protein